MRKIRNKKIILYIVVLGLLLLGGRGTDIGQLRPIEVVHLYEKGGHLLLKTDTGDMGWGLTVNQAVEKLKDTTPGEIYLDTADYLLLEEGMEEYIPILKGYLKGKTRVAYASEDVDLEEVAAYLRIHRPSGRLKNTDKPQEKVGKYLGKIILKNIKEI